MRMDPSRRDQSRRLHLLVACVAMVFLLIVLAASPGIAQEGSRLEKIEVVGLKRLTQEQAVTSSGLQLGQTVDRQILQAAVEKMMKSRLYSSVGYRVSAEDDKTTVTFEVVESNRPVPEPSPKTRPRTTHRRPRQ